MRHAETEIEGAKRNFAKIEEIEADSENYIYEYFEDIKRQVDLRRESTKELIDNESDKVIKFINETQSHLIKLSKEDTELKKSIENSKRKLNDIINKFDTSMK